MSDTVVTVGRDGARCANTRSYHMGVCLSFPIWAIKIYEKHTTKDGREVAKLAFTVGRTMADNRPSNKIFKEAKEYANENGYYFLSGVGQWDDWTYLVSRVVSEGQS